jgi:acyl-CoA reductase-like NAD-dependent aldehyde dehydrogenase
MSTETITSYPGAFVDGAEHANRGDPLPVTNPGTGEVFAEVPGGTAEDVDAAVSAAARAQADWSALAVSKRGEILGAAAHHVEAHLDELVPLLTREQGKTLRDSRIELAKAVDTLMHYVGLAKTLRGVHTPGLDPGVDGIVLRRPLGVVGAIVPWNFPTTLLCNKLAPALVAGNTMVAKPAGTTPLTTLRFAELLAEGGLPAGVFNVVTGGGSVTGTALVKHPRVRKIAFTGSTPVGEQIMALAAPGCKRVTLELGGSDPMIICDEVAGQVSCTLERGGTLLAGGGPPEDPELQGGFFYAPTVVADPPHDAPMATEEVFGPALPIWRVADLDEAIARANASPFGLGSSVWTRDLGRARQAAERIEAGYTWINSRTKVYDELPFGGWKSSGYGKEHGAEAFDYYTETKSVVFGSQP